MWKISAKFVLSVIAGLLLISACGLGPTTGVPVPTWTPEDLLMESSESPENDDQGVQCFVPRELTPLAFSLDNTQLLVRSGQGVQFIDIASGEETAFFPAPQPVITAALSPHGQYLAWSLGDNSIQIIQVPDSALRYSLSGHPDPVLHLRFSPSGDRLYSASHDGLVRIWNLQTGLLTASIDVGLEVVGIGVSHDGTVLATIPSDGPLQLWNTSSGTLMESLGDTVGFDTSDPVFSPDGAYLAADLASGLMVWSMADNRTVWDQPVNSLAAVFSPDGQWFAYSDIDLGNKIVLIRSDFQGSERVLDRMQGPVWELLFSPDGSLLAAIGGPEIRVWRVSDGGLVAVGQSSCP